MWGDFNIGRCDSGTTAFCVVGYESLSENETSYWFHGEDLSGVICKKHSVGKNIGIMISSKCREAQIENYIVKSAIRAMPAYRVVEFFRQQLEIAFDKGRRQVAKFHDHHTRVGGTERRDGMIDELKAVIKKIGEKKDNIAKERDALRLIFDELVDALESFDEGVDCLDDAKRSLEDAIDSISEVV